MKYGIWRHENSIGNSAEHTIGLYKHLIRNPDPDAEVYVENNFQKWFVLCIPCVKPENVKFFPFDMSKLKDESVYRHPFFVDVKMPNCYPFPVTYPATWTDLAKKPDCTLKFPEHLHTPTEDLPKDAIVIHFREKGTYQKRYVGSEEEVERFVKPEIMRHVIMDLADSGYKIVRVGDKNMTPLPEHKNIYDFALNGTGKIEDELYMIHHSKLFISTDSGIWPIVAGMKKNLLFTNITSPFHLITEKIPEEKRRFTERENKIVIPSEMTPDGKTHIEALIPMNLLKLDIVRWVPTASTQFLFKKYFWTEDKKGGWTSSNPPQQILAYAYKMLDNEKYLELKVQKGEK